MKFPQTMQIKDSFSCSSCEIFFCEWYLNNFESNLYKANKPGARGKKEDTKPGRTELPAAAKPP